MKTKLLMAAALTAILGLSSCGGEDAKLAGELAGTWKGSTTQMMNGKKEKPDKDGRQKDDRHKDGDRGKPGRMEDGEMSCTPTFTFVRTDGTNGGTLDISAGYTVTRGVESAAVSTPVKATVNGTVNASGTWTVKDGDEVMVTLDPSKTSVEVDTASMALSYARLTDAPQDSLGIIRERVASNIADVIKPMIAAKVQKVHKFDDVKVTGNTMTLDAGHARVSFTRQ